MMPTSALQYDVSVILPAYRSAAFIESTLASVTSQIGVTLEVIVVDDGSPDDTAMIVSRVAAASPVPVRLLRQTNQGIAAARNAALRVAKGRYIAFIDHDDVWRADKLRIQVALLDNSPDVGIAYSGFIVWDPSTPPSFPDEEIDATQWVSELSGWIYHQLLLTNWVLFSTALFRREVFECIGLLDLELPPADDWDLVLRASRLFRFVKLQSPLALYRSHSGQTSRVPGPRNLQNDLRTSMILRYGYASPDGQRVDEGRLRSRQVESEINFANGHLAVGSLRLGWRSMGRSICYSPLSMAPYVGLLNAFHKSITRALRKT